MRAWRKMTWVLLACLALIACGEDEPQMEGSDAGREEEAAANLGELLPEPEPEQPLSVGDTATVLFGPLDEGANRRPRARVQRRRGRVMAGDKAMREAYGHVMDGFDRALMTPALPPSEMASLRRLRRLAAQKADRRPLDVVRPEEDSPQ